MLRFLVSKISCTRHAKAVILLPDDYNYLITDLTSITASLKQDSPKSGVIKHVMRKHSFSAMNVLLIDDMNVKQ